MKRLFIKRRFILPMVLLSLLLLSNYSCTDYLDKSPDAGVNEDDAFKDFISFQGYIEGIYGMVTNPWNMKNPTAPNLADELVGADGGGYLNYCFDVGDYIKWMGTTESYFGRDMTFSTGVSTSDDQREKCEWPASWYGIYASNQGLANIDRVIATQAEKDVLKGQMLFFRGFFYFSLMRHWGGLPYVYAIDGSKSIPNLPRLSYQETAERAAKDMEDAANLLPLNWDAEPYGQLTLGNNKLRVNKIIAKSFQAKCLLYAASPLMNYESKGIEEYDTELCKRAAQIFKEVIDLSSSTGQYALEPWETVSNVFYTTNLDYPGGREMIWAAPLLVSHVVRAYFSYLYNSTTGTTFGCNIYNSLSYQYSKNFGMNNGLPITDPASGYNPSDPWVNRDPRFDKWVMIDGDQVTNAAQPTVNDRYAEIYNTGLHRGDRRNLTGLGTSKFWDIYCNKKDIPKLDNQFRYNPPSMRLADVYLMYAESVLWGYGTPQSTSTGSSLTAEDAVNLVRARAGVPPIDSKFTGSRDEFFEQLIVERAVELSFEGFRWDDLRRWLRNGDPKYLIKTALNFDRNSVGKPINMNEVVLRTRVVSQKHNWLPLPTDIVSIYPELYQNPGW